MRVVRTKRLWCAPARIAVAAGVVLAGLACDTPTVNAQELVNRDDSARGVTVMAKSVRRRFDVDAGKTIDGFCPDGCVIRIDEDAKRDFLIEGNERLSIEDGLVYFDGVVETRDTAESGEMTPPGDGATDGGKRN